MIFCSRSGAEKAVARPSSPLQPPAAGLFPAGRIPEEKQDRRLPSSLRSESARQLSGMERQGSHRLRRVFRQRIPPRHPERAGISPRPRVRLYLRNHRGRTGIFRRFFRHTALCFFSVSRLENGQIRSRSAGDSPGCRDQRHVFLSILRKYRHEHGDHARHRHHPALFKLRRFLHAGVHDQLRTAPQRQRPAKTLIFCFLQSARPLSSSRKKRCTAYAMHRFLFYASISAKNLSLRQGLLLQRL